MKRIAVCLLCLAAIVARAEEAPPAAVSLADFLKTQGYSEIELSENTAKQSEVEVVLNGKHSLVMLVDTGASMTLFDYDRLDDLGFELEKTDIEFHGVGGKQRLYSAQAANMELGGAETGPISLLVGDLSDFKKTLTAFGSRPVDGLIGHDFLSRYSAVIEVKHSKLYLRIR